MDRMCEIVCNEHEPQEKADECGGDEDEEGQ